MTDDLATPDVAEPDIAEPGITAHEVAAPGIACLPGTSDPNFKPSVLQLLEWYDVFLTEVVRRSPNNQRSSAPTDENHLVADVTHVPPEFLPNIHVIRALYESTCRGGSPDTTDNESQWHIDMHWAGWRH